MNDVRVGDIIRYTPLNMEVWRNGFPVVRVEGHTFWVRTANGNDVSFNFNSLPSFELLSKREKRKSGFASFVRKVENVSS